MGDGLGGVDLRLPILLTLTEASLTFTGLNLKTASNSKAGHDALHVAEHSSSTPLR